jgi:hypothetical protein
MLGEIDCVYNSISNAKYFAESRAAERHGLIKKTNVQICLSLSSVLEGSRVYKTRWLDIKKNIAGQSVTKSRLIAANYRDHDSRQIPTRSPTVTKAVQHIVMCMAASLDGTLTFAM